MSPNPNDYIEGTDEDDELFGFGGDDTLVGGLGNDTLTGGEGADWLVGGPGDDTLNGREDTNPNAAGFNTASYADAPVGVRVDLTISAAQDTGHGFDRLYYIDRLFGSAFNDILIASPGRQATLSGGAGDDLLSPATHVLGGKGRDTLTFSGEALEGSADVDLEAGTWAIAENQLPPIFHSGTLTSIEVVIGSSAGDVLRGGSAGDLLWGAGDHDILEGRAGDDGLLGEDGADSIYGGDGNDALGGGLGADRLWGDAGNDLLLGGLDNDSLDGGADADTLDGGGGVNSLLGGDGDDILSGEGRDTMDGGAGRDSVSLRFFLSGFEADLAAGTAGRLGDAPTATLIGIEDLVGDDYGNRFLGSSDANRLSGLRGEDTLVGREGDDSLDGGAGNDTLEGGDGDDRLLGGERDPFFGAPEADNLDGGAGSDTLDGGVGDDVLQGGEGKDTVSYAGAAAGVIVELSRTGAQATGGAGLDTLSSLENVQGSSGSDNLIGSRANNRLEGGGGDDTLAGGKGRDSLIGGTGADDLSGGGGGDRFILLAISDSGVDPATRDSVYGFSGQAGDRLDLSRIDAAAGGRDTAFQIVAAFTGEAGQLVLTAGRRFTLVEGDVDGDGEADLALVVYLADRLGDPLDAADFVL